jgi:chromosome segregation ATPase
VIVIDNLLQEEISQARSHIKELEEDNDSLKGEKQALLSQLAELRNENENKSKELSSLRDRTNLSQQNWVDERAELQRREAVAREEFEATKQAMQDWEILAMEERSIRESLTERVVELEEQLSAQKEAFEQAAAERDSQSLTVDGLQRALKDIQDGETRLAKR